MSATEEDTELRDLLIQNLENSGLLNKIKAEMRAAVFLAMEEQERLQNRTPLINENLKKCLNSRDGRLVASLILDFLQVFSLDFSLAVFQPEINSLNGLDSRDLVCRDLNLSESNTNKNCPLLLELVRRRRNKDGPATGPAGDGAQWDREDVSQEQICHARRKFDLYDKDLSGSILKGDVKNVFADLFPTWNKKMLESFVSNELQAADTHLGTDVDFQFFMKIYRRFFSQCRSVVIQDCDVSLTEKKPPSGVSQHQAPSGGVPRNEQLDLDVGLDNLDEGDSFFDDPLPKPQKTYGCVSHPEVLPPPSSPDPASDGGVSGPLISAMRRGHSLSDLSVLAADSEVDGGDLGSELRKVEGSGSRVSRTGSLSDGPKVPGGGRGSVAEPSKDDEDVEYDDDFNSHRSDLSRSEQSIGEEIEEVSIEGPEHSEKFDDMTQDLSLSQISQNHGTDYMEDVS